MARECTVASGAIQVDWIKVNGTLVADNGNYTTHSNRVDIEVQFSGRLTCNSRTESGGGCQACAYWAVIDSNDFPYYRYAMTPSAVCGNFDTFTFTKSFSVGYGSFATYSQEANTTETWEVGGAIYGEYEGLNGFQCQDSAAFEGDSIAAGSAAVELTFIFDE